tara:strand:+ start:450 stop:1205 length:756 start_codon:yes stop_codon:yes gene_type:complete
MNRELFEQSEVNQLNINISGYEGPLDLLLDLSKKQKVDILKISILELAEQYLLFINENMENIKLNADYLIMASFLAFLKSKLLLPEKDEEISELEEDITYRLVHYNAIKVATTELSSLPRQDIDFFTNKFSKEFFISESIVINANLSDLIVSYVTLYNKNNKESLKINEDKLYSVQNGLEWLQKIFNFQYDEWKNIFEFLPKDIYDSRLKKSAAVSILLASLNMVKNGSIQLSQKKNFSDIFVKVGKKNGQ